MTRAEEWEQMQQESAQTPAALDGSVSRARARAKKRLWKRRVFGVPLTGAAAVFLALVVLVNVSVPFAYAMSAAGLKSVVQAVSFNPSLRVALEHDYAQYVGQSQTIGDITVTVDAVIADSAQVNVFYRIDSKTYGKFHPQVSFFDAENKRIPLSGSITSNPRDYGKNNFATVDFGCENTPHALRFTVKIPEAAIQERDWTGPVWNEPATTWTELDTSTYTFSFDLSLSSYAIQQGERYDISRWLTIDGQRIYVENVEVYPSHIRILLRGDENNTALLQDLSFCLRDENGQENAPIRNGFVTSGEIEGDHAPLILHQESTFFWESEHLTLCITGAQWRDKETGTTTFDPYTGQSEKPLPPVIYYAEALPYGNAMNVVIAGINNSDFAFVSLASVSGASLTYYDLETNELPPDFHLDVPEECAINQIIIENYSYDDPIELTWNYTHETVLDVPIEIPIK